MYIPKKYGQSKVERCPFCSGSVTTVNKQGVPVCQKHKDDTLDGLRCVCGEYLDIKNGKFGPYFTCINCGNINFRKALDMNPNIKNSSVGSSSPKEITVRSDEI